MNYQEAISYSLSVRWKTTPCPTGKECWCRIIEPEEKIIDDKDNEIYIVGAGMISKEYAEHIVQLHNASIKANLG